MIGYFVGLAKINGFKIFFGPEKWLLPLRHYLYGPCFGLHLAPATLRMVEKIVRTLINILKLVKFINNPPNFRTKTFRVNNFSAKNCFGRKLFWPNLEVPNEIHIPVTGQVVQVLENNRVVEVGMFQWVQVVVARRLRLLGLAGADLAASRKPSNQKCQYHGK